VSCQISLGPNDDLELITPSGRRVYIPISPFATKEIWQVLWNASAERGPRPSGPGPAAKLREEQRREWQRIEDENAAWNEAKALEREARAEKAKERRSAEAVAKKVSNKYNINLEELDFGI